MSQHSPLQPAQNAPINDADVLDFVLPAEREADRPPEARGLSRDDVRLMVSYCSDQRIIHTGFKHISDFLAPGDVLVLNTSGTMNAALTAERADGMPFELHLSTHLPTDLWVVELRTLEGTATRPFYGGRAGETWSLPAGGQLTLHVPYRRSEAPKAERRQRLWIATLTLPCEVHTYLAQYGFPIRYSYVQDRWSLDAYQTVYVTEVGSAEMPSAGRAFTAALITELVAHGVQIAPLLLHTGVSSLEADEPPMEEWYRVPPETAQLVNTAHRAGKRVIAVGTTVVRALESVTDTTRTTSPGEGWTQLVITPQRGLYAVDGLLTGLHEPHATHLWMLEALAGRSHLIHTYRQALYEGYLWHEFGDLHLLLP